METVTFIKLNRLKVLALNKTLLEVKYLTKKETENTSKICYRCGMLPKSRREFRCLKCGLIGI